MAFKGTHFFLLNRFLLTFIFICFWVTNYEFEVKFQKFEMADLIWQTNCIKIVIKLFVSAQVKLLVVFSGH